MIYREFQKLRLSNLGMGAMRLPVLDGDEGRIDEEQTFRMVDAAMAGGVNYYDTAWGIMTGIPNSSSARRWRDIPETAFIWPISSPVTIWAISGKRRRSLRNSCGSAGWTISTSTSSTMSAS